MSALKEVKVPDIGNYKNIPVIELLVKVGDLVKQEQGLVSLESDKATMEVPSSVSGVIREIKVKMGDTVSEGTLVALIEETGNVSATTKQTQTVAAPVKSDAVTTTPPSTVRAEAAKTTPPAATSVTPFDAQRVLPEAVPYASPSVRLYARELGVDLAQLLGSGRKERIVREDVQNYVKSVLAGNRSTHGSSSANGLQLLPWPQIDFEKFGPIETKPLSKIQKISGANLARNWAMIPHVTQNDEADITEMEAFRKSTVEQVKDVKVTPLVFLIKAVVAALKRFPSFNASLDATGGQLILKKYIHIGIAVDTPDGLVVPVIRNCDQKGLLDLARELAAISLKARDKKLTPADMSGGCFSISSLGGIGGTGFTPIINAPEVAILGVSKSSTRPMWDGAQFVPRLMLPLSLSYDHRVIDGAEAARFTAYLAQLLGDVRRLLL
jgi:pyruvate dehydrogenase E2 component (dihydrolipoamide acetyltransferase)